MLGTRRRRLIVIKAGVIIAILAGPPTQTFAGAPARDATARASADCPATAAGEVTYAAPPAPEALRQAAYETTRVSNVTRAQQLLSGLNKIVKNLPVPQNVRGTTTDDDNGTATRPDTTSNPVQGGTPQASLPTAAGGSGQGTVPPASAQPRAPEPDNDSAKLPQFIYKSQVGRLGTSKITIPEGKFGYLMDDNARAESFRDVLAFDRGTFDTALRSHLVDNLGYASDLRLMNDGDGHQIGVKFTVTNLITAYPQRRNVAGTAAVERTHGGQG